MQVACGNTCASAQEGRTCAAVLSGHLKLASLLSESAKSAVARKSASDLCCTGDVWAFPSRCRGVWGASANTACHGVSCSYSKPYSSFKRVRISACRHHSRCQRLSTSRGEQGPLTVLHCAPFEHITHRSHGCRTLNTTLALCPWGNTYVQTDWQMRGHLGIACWAQPALVLWQCGCIQCGFQALLMVCSAAIAITQNDVILLHVSMHSAVSHRQGDAAYEQQWERSL